MAYRPSQARFGGGGKVKYLVYRSAQSLRNGRMKERTRVKRIYFPATAREISVGQPAALAKRTGRRVYGVAVRYQYRLPATTAHRGRTRYKLPERWTQRLKVVELPEGTKQARLADRPPEGPRMAVA